MEVKCAHPGCGKLIQTMGYNLEVSRCPDDKLRITVVCPLCGQRASLVVGIPEEQEQEQAFSIVGSSKKEKEIGRASNG